MRDNPHHAFAASQVTRVLILSYFVALALGLIDGAELTRLAAPFMPDNAAQLVMRVYVLALTALILFGIFRRPAALVLALTLFWASYMTMYAVGDVTGFWRDLALIGGLLISAGVGQGWTLREDGSDGEDYDLNLVPEAGPAPPPVSDTIQVPLRRVSMTRVREDLDLARDG